MESSRNIPDQPRTLDSKALKRLPRSCALARVHLLHISAGLMSYLIPMVLEFRPSQTRNFNESHSFRQTRILRPRNPALGTPSRRGWFLAFLVATTGMCHVWRRDHAPCVPASLCLFCFIHHILVILFGNINQRLLPRRLLPRRLILLIVLILSCQFKVMTGPRAQLGPPTATD